MFRHPHAERGPQIRLPDLSRRLQDELTLIVELRRDVGKVGKHEAHLIRIEVIFELNGITKLLS